MSADGDLLRRYLGRNDASYLVDPVTLSPISGSYSESVLRSEALAAIARLEAAAEAAATEEPKP